jgi:hypothetical protein
VTDFYFYVAVSLLQTILVVSQGEKMNKRTELVFSSIGRLFHILLITLLLVLMSVGSAAAATPPPTPTLLSPANGASVQVPFTISWTAVTDPSGIIAYNWQVSPSSTMAPVILQNSTNGTTTQDTVSGLAVGTYYWQVQAVSGAFVQGAWSTPQSFTVTGSGSAEPGIPTLNPPNGYNTFHPMEVFTFTWNAVAGAATYDLDFATDPSFPIASEVHFDNISGTTFSTEFGDSLTGNFYARVRAVTSTRILGVPSNLQTFSVFFNNPLPLPPNPLSPANGAKLTLPITLSWSNVPNPQPGGYILEVAKDSGFSNIELSVNQITDPNYTITSLTSGTKYWHVRSMQGDSAPDTPALTAWATTQSFSIPFSPPNVVSVTLANATPSNGFTETFWIQLTTAAPSGGAVINMTSSNPSAAPVPATVTMPAGVAFGQFTFQIGAVTSPTPVTITASLNGTSASVKLTVEPPGLQSLTISPSTITGGGQPQLTVMLNGNAPSGGIVVNLSSNSPTASPPSSVTVQAGSPSAVLNIPTSAVNSNTNVTITASYNGASLQAQVTLTPQIAPASLSLNPTTTGSSSCCSSGTVTIASAAPSDTEIFLSISNPSVASVPTAVMVPQGSTTGGFNVQTTVVSANTNVTITATGAGVSKSAVLTIVPPGTASSSVSSLVLNPANLTGGSTSQGTVLLSSAAPSGGLSVTLSSSNTSVATVPSGLTVPAGATSAGFTVTTSAVTASTNVTISASGGGGSTSIQMTVNPANSLVISSLTLNPTSVTAGNSSTGTVTLSAAAPTGGESVPLSSSNVSVATTPTNVVVPAGSTSVTFTVSTSSTTAATTTVLISASDGGVTKSANLTVSPASSSSVSLSSLKLSQTSISGGNSLNGTVTLSAAAPSGGIVVALTSSNSSVASVPSSVTISAGSTSANFKIRTQRVSSNTNVTISGTYNGVTKSASLTVTSGSH